MKKWLAICILALFLANVAAACGFSDKSVNQEPVPEASELEIRDESSSQEEAPAKTKSAPYSVDLQTVTIPAPSLSSNLIGEPDTREISVLLPQSYHDNENEYPVVYFLNGYGSPHENSASIALNAMTSLSMEDLIVVCIDAVSRLNCSYYVNSPVTGNWQDFVTEDVVGYIDNNYRTIAEASGRGLSGHSIGGFGAVNIALNTEGIFSHVYAMSPAVLAPDGLVTYGLRFEPVSFFAQEYQSLSAQEARERYLKKIEDPGWQPRYAFDYGSAFAYDEKGKAPYILIPERTAAGEYLRDNIWERYQSGLGGPPQRIKESRERLLKLGGLVVDYGSRDELTWVLDGCKYLAKQLEENEIPFDLRVYDGDHSSEIPNRLISDVLPYFADKLGD